MSSTYDSLPDESIIKLYFDKRDPQAASYLFKKYLPVVYGIALKYCRDKHNAEDIAMLVFEKLLSMNGKPIINFKSWLCMVARNMALEFINKKNKKQAKENVFEESVSNFMENGEEMHLINEDKVETEKILSTLEHELGELKDDQRICIEMFYYKNMSYQQISDQLGMDLKQVKSNIQNGKRKLKILMDQKNHRNE